MNTYMDLDHEAKPPHAIPSTSQHSLSHWINSTTHLNIFILFQCVLSSSSMEVPLSERPEAASFKFVLEEAPSDLSNFYVIWALQLSGGVLGDNCSYSKRDEEFTVYTTKNPKKLRSSLQKCFAAVDVCLRPLPEARGTVTSNPGSLISPSTSKPLEKEKGWMYCCPS